MIQLAIDPSVPAQPAPGPRIVSPAHFVANALTLDPEDPTTLEQAAVPAHALVSHTGSARTRT